MKRSVYTAVAVMSSCTPRGAACTAGPLPVECAFYVLLVHRDASAQAGRKARCFGPFSTIEQARMIRASAFSLGLATAELDDQAGGANELEEAPWRQQASM